MATIPGTNAYNTALNAIALAYFFSDLSVEQAGTGGSGATPTNFGDDFLVGSGVDSYQVQVHYEGMDPTAGAGVELSRIRVTIILHHLIFGVDDTPAQRQADIQYFMLDHVNWMRAFCEPPLWRARGHIYDVAGAPDEDKDGDMETEDIERVGDVLTWKYSITLLVDNL